MRFLRNELDFPSLLKYAAWRLVESQSKVRVRLVSGSRLELRPQPFGDLFNATEIFVHEVYRCPCPELLSSVETVVDVGANIGLSCLYWAHLFASAKIFAFEPHPVHVEMLKRHLQLNDLMDRVTVFNGAAGPSDGEAVLSDASLCSSLVTADESGGQRVPVFDLYRVLGNRRIDLMKMDVEGYEYPILSDDRFASLLPRTIVMEWHNTSAYPNGKAWCMSRLTGLNYRVLEGNDSQPDTGILWAFRSDH